MNSIHANLFVTKADVVARLREIGVEPTDEAVFATIGSMCNIAYAWATAWLQDLTADRVESILEGDDD
jgi:hypothetical protein